MLSSVWCEISYTWYVNYQVQGIMQPSVHTGWPSKSRSAWDKALTALGAYRVFYPEFTTWCKYYASCYEGSGYVSCIGKIGASALLLLLLYVALGISV